MAPVGSGGVMDPRIMEDRLQILSNEGVMEALSALSDSLYDVWVLQAFKKTDANPEAMAKTKLKIEGMRAGAESLLLHIRSLLPAESSATNEER